jgi:phosphoglycerate kinase
LLLENLRFYKQEEVGTEDFAGKLSKHGDVYVNDAFGTAHRAHASTTIVANFFPEDKLFGYVMAGEINSVEKVLNYSEKPVTAILGGAKVSGKILILENLMNRVNNIIIGGGMSYTFIKALGGNIGSSLVEEDKIQVALDTLKKAKEKNVSIYLPSDTVTADSFSNDANKNVCDIYKITDGCMGLDIGPETEKKYEEIILASKTVLWNGPMGVFEFSNFESGTKAVANAVVKATQKGAFTLIGGGDSVAAINKYKMGDKVSYVSTGGGAMLEYLEGKELPGIAAINR